jgi:hypothetical protein
VTITIATTGIITITTTDTSAVVLNGCSFYTQ